MMNKISPRRRWWAPKRDAYLPGLGDPAALAEALAPYGYRRKK